VYQETELSWMVSQLSPFVCCMLINCWLSRCMDSVRFTSFQFVGMLCYADDFVVFVTTPATLLKMFAICGAYADISFFLELSKLSSLKIWLFHPEIRASEVEI
jgi:hypothetical protein